MVTRYLPTCYPCFKLRCFLTFKILNTKYQVRDILTLDIQRPPSSHSIFLFFQRVSNMSKTAIQSNVEAASERYAASFTQGHLALPPAKKYLVLTCMDARIDPARAFGIDLGDAHVIRNVSALPSPSRHLPSPPLPSPSQAQCRVRRRDPSQEGDWVGGRRQEAKGGKFF